MEFNFQSPFVNGPFTLQDVLADNQVLQRIHRIFTSLVLADFANRRYRRGRKGYGRHPLLRALILRHYLHIRFISTLRDQLMASSELAILCGFRPGKIPDQSVFYRFLTDTPNAHLQQLVEASAQGLIEQGAIPARIIIGDSKPICACTRDNNPKNPGRNLNSDQGPPPRNPRATVSYYSYLKVPADQGDKKQFTWFWGYRTHAIITVEGVCLVETTEPNNRTDATVVKKLLKRLKRRYGTQKGKIFIGDSAYDEKALYNLLVDQMHMQAFIPINPRNTQERTDKDFDEFGVPVCPSGLTMTFTGRCTETHRVRLKYRCPVKTDKTVADPCGNACPINDPHFTGYGCTRYVDVTRDARSQVPRHTDLFKKTYKLREGVEHYFARFGDCEVEKTGHYLFRSIKNQMTLGHLMLNLVAVAAVALGRPENLRCRRTFARTG